MVLRFGLDRHRVQDSEPGRKVFLPYKKAAVVELYATYVLSSFALNPDEELADKRGVQGASRRPQRSGTK